MRAIVISEFGEPDVLTAMTLPEPEPAPGTVVIRVKAFGLNRAELYMRRGEWPEASRVSGIECAGTVESDVDGRLVPGQKVVDLMGGMGRTIDGSYAELTRVPSTNVVPIASALSWEQLAAIPESYATAWQCLALADGTYKAEPAHVLPFDQIRQAHRVMEAGQTMGKIVVTGWSS